jgi:gluconolactonase
MRKLIPFADGQPTGAPVKTYDYTPHAGGAAFDDSRWEAIAPTSLTERRSTGRLCFAWYRINITVPEHQGKRLNSPNDLVYRSDGTLYFTDPPFGLPKFFDDPGKELPVSGVYSVYHGRLQQIATDFTGPNGIAFSPGEKYLYVTNWDEKKKAIMRYEALPDGTLANGKLFFDMTAAPGEDALDGMKVDQQGNLYVSGPGGLWVISAEGKHLGTIIAPMHPHNLAWGDEDGKTLYLCARTGLYRMRLNIAGVRP